MTAKLRIRNWDRWQSYRRDRGQPPWIKVHREVMRNIEWVGMTDAQRGQLVAIWLLAADHDGAIPASPGLVQKLCFMSEPPDLNFFIEQGFIEPDANVTPDRRQTDAGTTHQNRGRGETETEGEVEKPLSSSQKREPDRSAEVREVFDYWREVHDHPRAKLDDKRYRAIRARFSDGYSTDDLKTAVAGCLKSPHHQGENDRATVYDDIELICRSAKHVDQFIRFADGPDLTSMSKSARQTAIAAAEWITEGNA